MEQECATGFLTNKQIALEETKHTDSTKKPQEKNNWLPATGWWLPVNEKTYLEATN